MRHSGAPPRQRRASAQSGAGVSLERALSKLGLCSRTQAARLVAEGRVSVDGRRASDPSARVDLGRVRIAVDDQAVVAERKVYLILNKPRGLVTTRSDPQDRQTVYACLEGHDLPFVSPVGRLDKASEGLLLMTNDTRWAQRLTDPASHVDKVYHVHVDAIPDEAKLARLQAGALVGDEHLSAKAVRRLRSGGRNAWLEIVLDEGKNRHIRRLLEAFGLGVLRLVRVAIGNLALGDLPKGTFRHLSAAECASLGAGPSTRQGVRKRAIG